jgi:hypothetical protein
MRSAAGLRGLLVVLASMGCALPPVLKEVVPYRASTARIRRLYVVLDQRVIWTSLQERSGFTLPVHIRSAGRVSGRLTHDLVAAFAGEGLEVKVSAYVPEDFVQHTHDDIEAAMARRHQEDVERLDPDAILEVELTSAYWNLGVFTAEYEVRLNEARTNTLLWRAHLKEPPLSQTAALIARALKRAGAI